MPARMAAAARWAMTVVLPVPTGASTSNGPCRYSTAWRCCSFRSSGRTGMASHSLRKARSASKGHPLLALRALRAVGSVQLDLERFAFALAQHGDVDGV